MFKPSQLWRIKISTKTRGEEISGVESCDVHISRGDVEAKQHKSPLGLGITVARIKVFDGSGRWCWFVIDAQIDENGLPIARTTAIGEVEHKSVDSIGSWRTP